MKFADLHTHTFYSDGVLSPAELSYRAIIAGNSALAITDHVDYSNIDMVINKIQPAVRRLSHIYGIEILAGVELTYIPPEDIEKMVNEARRLGADIVVVHGETPAENVPPGTNAAAIRAGCDILAHPGEITLEDAQMAAKNQVFLELTTRRGHKETNSHVAKLALEVGAPLVINSDAHSPKDILNESKVKQILEETSLGESYWEKLFSNSMSIVDAAVRKRKNRDE